MDITIIEFTMDGTHDEDMPTVVYEGRLTRDQILHKLGYLPDLLGSLDDDDEWDDVQRYKRYAIAEHKDSIYISFSNSKTSGPDPVSGGEEFVPDEHQGVGALAVWVHFSQLRHVK